MLGAFPLVFALIVTPPAARDSGGPAPAEPVRAAHVVVVSIDGLRPEFYLDARWPAPTIQQMAREGAYAEAVRTVVPSVTYPSHTTLVTGALPGRHGVYYNLPFEEGGQTGRWYWEARWIRVPTLWDALARAGRETASITWPVTVGASITRYVPEIWPLEQGADPLAAMRAEARPHGLFEELEREATGRLDAGTFTSDYLTRDDRAGAMAAYLLERYRPTLLLLHLLGADHFQHAEGRDGPMVRRAVAAVDRAVGQVVEAAQRAGILERTAFVIAGDHGFVDIHTRVAPNVWLVAAGLMENRRDRGNWRAAFHSHGGTASLHLRSPGDTATLQRVRRTLADLPPAVRRFFRVLERPELDRLGADPSIPLMLAAVPGVVFGNASAPPAVSAAQGGTHGYLPEFPEIYTGFVAWGSGVRAGAVAPQIGLEDVAPFVAELLGIEFQAPDGVAPLGLLAPAGER